MEKNRQKFNDNETYFGQQFLLQIINIFTA